MFSLQDIPKFILAFFFVLPVISILHEGGHVFFAKLMGAKNIRVIIGSGKPLFHIGILEVRKYYFWYGVCSFEKIERKEKFANVLIFLGGVLFNFIGTVLIMIAIEKKIIESSMITYQFTYFSLYYIFFALLPMPYPDGNYSDGKIILDLLKGKDEIIKERTYKVRPLKKEGKWELLGYDNKLIDSFESEEDALNGAREIARENRPSRILVVKEGKEKEIQNYPRIPL